MPATAAACLIIILSVCHSGVASKGWKYGDEEHWPLECKEGRKQSPIALSNDIATQQEFSALIFEKYNETYPAQLKNNGHSAEIRIYNTFPLSVRNGGLHQQYILDHLHFHWQSEHTIDDYRFPLELHLVHYANIYKNLEEALKHREGVAVFSVLFDLSPDDDKEFEPLIKIINKLYDNVDQNEEMNLSVEDYLPRDTAGFYRYNGSLTTPNCTEGIIWTVFTNTLPISKNQVGSFSMMKTKDKEVLDKNYRSLQDLNGRVVHLKVSPIRSSSSNIYMTYQKLSIVLVFIYLIKSN